MVGYKSNNVISSEKVVEVGIYEGVAEYNCNVNNGNGGKGSGGYG